MNRQITGRIAALNFAPTELSHRNLIREGISTESVVITGNTVIDALYWVVNRLREDVELME